MEITVIASLKKGLEHFVGPFGSIRQDKVKTDYAREVVSRQTSYVYQRSPRVVK